MMTATFPKGEFDGYLSVRAANAVKNNTGCRTCEEYREYLRAHGPNNYTRWINIGRITANEIEAFNDVLVNGFGDVSDADLEALRKRKEQTLESLTVARAKVRKAKQAFRDARDAHTEATAALVSAEHRAFFQGPPKRNFSDRDREVLEKHVSGASKASLAREYGLSPTTIAAAITKAERDIEKGLMPAIRHKG